MTEQSLRDLFQSKFDSERWTDVLQNVFGAGQWLKAVPQVLDNTPDGITGEFLGKIVMTDNLELGLFKYNVDGSVSKKRVELRNLVRTFVNPTNGMFDAALAVFDDGTEWRVSFITDIKNNATNPKRYTYVFGNPKNGYRTAITRFTGITPISISLKTLKEAFSVDALTKEFYDELFAWYEGAIKLVKLAGKKPKIEEHVIRLITRLMFCWFIKQQNLVPDVLFRAEDVSRLLKNFQPDSTTDGGYYNAILQNLFFATLNCEISDRKFASDSQNKYGDPQYNIATMFRDNNGDTMFAKSHEEIRAIFDTIPFLNGGLFECLVEDEHGTDDGFSRNPAKRAFIPNCLFFGERGILTILSRYNWTVEENTPSDVVVALDPELLGKVFENLLGTYNEETKDTARKKSGSFYTPRQVVQYMVDESIAEYIETVTGINAATVKRVITELEIPADIKHEKLDLHKIEKALTSMKILDPACGSGAFPMGILNRTVEIIDKIRGGMSQQERYNLKLELIENCIYGVDIQTIAIQISKLRCFMSLVAEQEKTDNKSDNYGIRPLPNLETKFVAANTLIKLKDTLSSELKFDDLELTKLKSELKDIRSHKIIKVGTHKEKKKLKQQDEIICNKIALLVSEHIGKPNQSLIKQYTKDIASLEKEKLQYLTPKIEKVAVTLHLFDTDDAQNVKTIDVNKEKRRALDKKIKYLQSQIDFENVKERNRQTDTQVLDIIRWNPYKPTNSATFFDSEWMFGITDGFDIVIGNPPYVQMQKFKLSAEDKKAGKTDMQKVYQSQEYVSYDSMGDIYQLFYERGMSLTKKCGLLCYITSNKWLRAGYGESTRQLFSMKYNPKLLLDMGGQVFKSATVDTNIVLVQNDHVANGFTQCWKKTRDIDPENMSDLIAQQGQRMQFTSEPWVILSPIEQSIKAKIEKYGTPLKDWDVNIYRGILTGCNEAFIIDEDKKNELVAKDKNSAQIIRPILRGRDIQRNGYNFANLYMICTFPSKHYNIDNFPAVKAHLENFGKDDIKHLEKYGQDCFGRKRLGQTGEAGCRKKTNNKWFETQDSISYWDEFSKPKIVYSETNNSIQTKLFFDSDGYMLDKTCFFVVSSDQQILEHVYKIMSSDVFTWYMRNTSPLLANAGISMTKDTVERFPLCAIGQNYHLTEEEIKHISSSLNL